MCLLSHSLLSALGTAACLAAIYKTLDFIWLYVRPSGLHKYLHARNETPAWSLVTGSSAGIGKALAFELAAKGFNVVLHGRNPVKLECVKAEISKRHPACSIRILVTDASKCHMDSTWLNEAVESLSDINLTILVNNAGGGSDPSFGTLDQYSPQQILDNLHLNAAFPALLTAALIPVLHRNSPSLLINICSVSDNGVPLVSFYSATKAFCRTLSQALWREMSMEGRRIEVIAHRLGLVTETQLTQTKPYIWGPPANVVAKAILARTGCGKKTVVPYWAHGLQELMINFVPAWLLDKIMMNFMRDVRVKDELAKGT